MTPQEDPAAASPPTLATAGVLDTAHVVGGVLTPIVAEGVLARRKTMVRLGGRLDTHGKAARILNGLKDRYDADALRLRFPRKMVVALRPPAVQAILHGTPDPFIPASREKVSTLSRFQPTGVLVSDLRHRPARRELNEFALQTSAPVHTLYERCAVIVREEVGELLAECHDGRLTWDVAAIAHWRMVRRLVFGDATRDQEDLTDMLTRLRHDANWAYAFPPRKDKSAGFRRRLDELVSTAPRDSLAGIVREAPVADRDTVDPTGQIPQWLFAFDAVAVAIHRALALLATDPNTLARAREDIRDLDAGRSPRLPILRATLLESVRLWPTTLAILWETVRDVPWSGGVIPAGTTTVILGEHFQRDDDAMDFAQRFAPDAWLDGRAQAWPVSCRSPTVRANVRGATS